MRILRPLLLAAVVAVTICPAVAQEPTARVLREYVRIEPGRLRSDGLATVGAIHRSLVGEDEYLHGVVLLKTRMPVSLSKHGELSSRELMQALAGLGVRSIRQPFSYYMAGGLAAEDRVGLARIFEVTFDATSDPFETSRRLEESGLLEYAEPVFVRRTSFVPNDPRYAEQYAMSLVESAEAWGITRGDTSVLIAITDSGFDWMHEDLADNLWTNTGEIPDNGKDDDGNGKKDDIRGWDFVGNVSLQGVLLNQFVEDNDTRITALLPTNDARHHGTHVGGVAAASIDNGKGIAGMAGGCRILPVKIGSDQIPSSIYRGYEAIAYAAAMGADVINCSWGGGPWSAAEQDVIDQATSMGSLVVAAAGNAATDIDLFAHYPANYHGVLSVGATDAEDAAANFSNYGISTRVWAPGVKILSTVSGENRYDDQWSGTSMATPLVSGIAALLKSIHPSWSPERIAQQIRSTALNVVTTDSSLRPSRYGRVNALRALAYNDAVDSLALPGLIVRSLALQAPGGIIVDTAVTTARLTVANLLADARDLSIDLLSVDGSATLGDAGWSVDTLAGGSETELEFTLQIADVGFWIEGNSRILVRFRSGDYVDYELIQVPFRFPSSNSYTTVLEGLPGETRAYAGSSPSPEIFWGVGEVPGLGGGYIRYLQGQVSYGFPASTPVNAVWGLSGSTAIAVTGTTILRTTNGGGGWLPRPQPSMRSLDAIHFFDGSEGVIIGSDTTGDLTLLRSTDGGSTWSSGTSIPTDPGEYALASAISWKRDEGIIGTTLGRAIRSTDRGRSWTTLDPVAGRVIIGLAIDAPERALAVYVEEEDSLHLLRTMATTDGGATWTDRSTLLGEFSLRPIHISSPIDGAVLLMGDDGRIVATRDNGRTWDRVPTQKSNAAISAGASIADPTKVRIWNLGTQIGFTDIPLDNLSAAPTDRHRAEAVAIRGLHPNPATTQIALEVVAPAGSDLLITLVDATGRHVAPTIRRRTTEERSQVIVPVADLPSGSYFLQATTGAASDLRRVTIVR